MHYVRSFQVNRCVLRLIVVDSAIVTLGDDAPCYFNPASSIGPADSESSFTETPTGPDPLDFSLFMDQVR